MKLKKTPGVYLRQASIQIRLLFNPFTVQYVWAILSITLKIKYKILCRINSLATKYFLDANEMGNKMVTKSFPWKPRYYGNGGNYLETVHIYSSKIYCSVSLVIMHYCFPSYNYDICSIVVKRISCIIMLNN